MTTPIDISPDAVEIEAAGLERMDGTPHAVAAMLRELRTALTASESLLREWVKNYESADTNSFRLAAEKLDVWRRTTAILAKGETK